MTATEWVQTLRDSVVRVTVENWRLDPLRARRATDDERLVGLLDALDASGEDFARELEQACECH